MPSLTDLATFRERLWSMRANGLREVRDQNGESVTYRSDAELRAAIAAVDAEMARASGQVPSTVLFRTSKGV